MSLKPGPILTNFYKVVTQPQFYTYAFTGSIAFAGLFAYVAGSPVIFMNVFGLGAKEYGWIFAGLSLGFIGMSQCNTILLKYFSSEQIIRVALLCYAVTGILLFAMAELQLLHLPLMIVLLFVMLGCVGITNPNASAMALAPFSEHAGSASALMGASQMGLGALASVGISFFDKPSLLPMASLIMASSLLALLVFYLGKRKIVHKVVVKKEIAVPMH